MYPVDIKKRDLKMASLIATQYGGPQGEALKQYEQRRRKYKDNNTKNGKK